MSRNHNISRLWEIILNHGVFSFCLCTAAVVAAILLFHLRVSFVSDALLRNIGLTAGGLAFFLWFRTVRDTSTVKQSMIACCWPLFFLSLGSITILQLGILNSNTAAIAEKVHTMLVAASLLAGYVLFHSRADSIRRAIASDKIHEAQIKNYWYIAGLIAVTVLGFVLRVWNLQYVQGTDNFNLLSAKSFAENGFFVYHRNLHITYLVGTLFKILGVSLPIARLPFVLIGTLSIPVIYLIGKTIHKKVGLLSALLLAISPVAIEKSSIVREYSELLFWSLIIVYIAITLYAKYKDQPRMFLKTYIASQTLIALIVYEYGQLVDSGTFKSLLSVIFFISIPIGYYIIKDAYGKFIYAYGALVVIGLGLLVCYIHIPISIFSSRFVYNPYWIQMFFDPMVPTPMQWFSFSTMPMVFMIGVFCLSLIPQDRTIRTLQCGFWSIVLLFVFKYYSIQGYYHSRYLYFIYPLYIIIFASSLYGAFWLVQGRIYKFLYAGFLVAAILIYVCIPQNTLHGARHDLSIWDDSTDLRQPTSFGNRNAFLQVIDLLKQAGFTNKKPIVIQGEGAFFVTWYFNIPITKTYAADNKAANGNLDAYEIGQNVYIVDTAKGVNELDTALQARPIGYLLWHSSYYPANNFVYHDTEFHFVGTVENYKVYTWSSPLL